MRGEGKDPARQDEKIRGIYPHMRGTPRDLGSVAQLVRASALQVRVSLVSTASRVNGPAEGRQFETVRSH